MSVRTVPKALQEVWEWKEAVFQETQNMSFKERLEYSERNLQNLGKELQFAVDKTPDGHLRLVKK